MATTLHIGRTVRGVAILRAHFHQPFRDEVRDRRPGPGSARTLLNLSALLGQEEVRWADGLQSHRVLHTIVLAADAPLACTRIPATRASSATRETVCVRVLIVAACPAFANANTSAAGRVNPAREVHAISVGASLEELILAFGEVRYWVLVAMLVGATLASRSGASVSTTLTVLIALEMNSILIGAAFCIQRHAETTATFMIVSASKVGPIVSAYVQLSLALRC